MEEAEGQGQAQPTRSRCAVDGAGGLAARAANERRPTVTNDRPAPRHRRPAVQKAHVYSPVTVRIDPAPSAASDAPTWWLAAIQPYMTPVFSRPNASEVRRTVGGTVAIQSRP